MVLKARRVLQRIIANKEDATLKKRLKISQSIQASKRISYQIPLSKNLAVCQSTTILHQPK